MTSINFPNGFTLQIKRDQIEAIHRVEGNNLDFFVSIKSGGLSYTLKI